MIRGGRDGYERLLVLAAARRPCTLEFLELTGVRPGMRCVGHHASQVKPTRIRRLPEGQSAAWANRAASGSSSAGSPAEAGSVAG